MVQSPLRISAVGQEVGTFAGVQTLGALHPHGQQLLATRLEFARELDHEAQRLGGEDGFVTGFDVTGNFHALGQIDGQRHVQDLQEKS